MTGLGIELGNKIKALRNGRNIKQAEFADLLGVTKSAVSSYENGTRLPSYEVLIKIARIFRVSTDYLLGCSAGNLSGCFRPDGPADQHLAGHHQRLPGKQPAQSIKSISKTPPQPAAAAGSYWLFVQFFARVRHSLPHFAGEVEGAQRGRGAAACQRADAGDGRRDAAGRFRPAPQRLDLGRPVPPPGWPGGWGAVTVTKPFARGQQQAEHLVRVLVGHDADQEHERFPREQGPQGSPPWRASRGALWLPVQQEGRVPGAAARTGRASAPGPAPAGWRCRGSASPRARRARSASMATAAFRGW